MLLPEMKIIQDNYSRVILETRFYNYKKTFIDTEQIIKITGLKIRHQNPPEDITENIAKFIIHNYENDNSCEWCKSIGLNGDLYSKKYKSLIEIKAFTSPGPSSFGPTKKFDKIYFLDMQKWLEDIFVLWKVNVNHESKEWINLKINKTQTFQDQCTQGRRPHLSWFHIYNQIPEKCEKIYNGSFDGVFFGFTETAKRA
jgi:hypothetical protein